MFWKLLADAIIECHKHRPPPCIPEYGAIISCGILVIATIVLLFAKFKWRWFS